MGTGIEAVNLKRATADLRAASGLAGCETIRREGAPIPLKPSDRWDYGRDEVLAGEAAGVVPPPARARGSAMPSRVAAWRQQRRGPPLPRARRKT